MATIRCGRCGKSLPKGDRMAAIAHAVRCKKNVVNGGLYLGHKKVKK